MFVSEQHIVCPLLDKVFSFYSTRDLIINKDVIKIWIVHFYLHKKYVHKSLIIYELILWLMNF